ncbi:pyrroline-5-carboxylate reductase [Synechococcus sp. BIOS-U3-1]|uniref:pyrroline-5-carboxylate reductase n=1 Tax=Synechococcus sp. BIOS-U3-1 TaxID=1400865 RepID=UPI001647A41E|nr:pyrroline-5-carboxylate reductase [Synechococcus sp. BIOS-U3-1]QNI57566.1 pyrroline-5-carboxylate reductase [Synechococcus sp. BIOS-U3-1]
MTFSLGVIGLGRMAQALIFPLIERGKLLPADVIGVVGSQASVSRLIPDLPNGLTVVPASDPRAVSAWNASVQLLAVKPQQLDAVAECVGPAQSDQPPLLISVLAGVTLERLQNQFPGRACVRAVPNTPCLVGEGLCGLAWGEGITAQQRQWVKAAFDPVSEVLELPESRLDAFLALTSSGPAYVALVAEAMADGAVAAGLPRELAHRLAHRTLAGTAALLDQQQLHPALLKDMVASPGGTTMAALRTLESAGVRTALIEAVVAAAEHGRALR